MTTEVPPPPAAVYPDDYPLPPGWSNDQAVRFEGGGDPQSIEPPSHPLENPEPPPEPGSSNERASRDGLVPLEESTQERVDATSVYIEPGESNARAVRAEDAAPTPTPQE
jgi:hypothetical protein